MEIIKIKRLIIAHNKKTRKPYHYFKTCKNMDKSGTFIVESLDIINNAPIWETDFVSCGKVINTIDEFFDIIEASCLAKVRQIKIDELLNEQREVLQRPKRWRARRKNCSSTL